MWFVPSIQIMGASSFSVESNRLIASICQCVDGLKLKPQVFGTTPNEDPTGMQAAHLVHHRVQIKVEQPLLPPASSQLLPTPPRRQPDYSPPNHAPPHSIRAATIGQAQPVASPSPAQPNLTTDSSVPRPTASWRARQAARTNRTRLCGMARWRAFLPDTRTIRTHECTLASSQACTDKLIPLSLALNNQSSFPYSVHVQALRTICLRRCQQLKHAVRQTRPMISTT